MRKEKERVSIGSHLSLMVSWDTIVSLRTLTKRKYVKGSTEKREREREENIETASFEQNERSSASGLPPFLILVVVYIRYIRFWSRVPLRCTSTWHGSFIFFHSLRLLRIPVLKHRVSTESPGTGNPTNFKRTRIIRQAFHRSMRIRAYIRRFIPPEQKGSIDDSWLCRNFRFMPFCLRELSMYLFL